MLSRRRFLAAMLPASLLQPWPGATMEPAAQVEFVYNVTQELRGRIDEHDAKFKAYDKLVKLAYKYFGFENPYRQSDKGDV